METFFTNYEHDLSGYTSVNNLVAGDLIQLPDIAGFSTTKLSWVSVEDVWETETQFVLSLAYGDVDNTSPEVRHLVSIRSLYPHNHEVLAITRKSRERSIDKSRLRVKLPDALCKGCGVVLDVFAVYYPALLVDVVAGVSGRWVWDCVHCGSGCEQINAS